MSKSSSSSRIVSLSFSVVRLPFRAEMSASFTMIAESKNRIDTHLIKEKWMGKKL